MSVFSLDLETYSDWENVPESVRSSAVRAHRSKTETPEQLAALSPYTGRIISITVGKRARLLEAASYRTFIVPHPSPVLLAEAPPQPDLTGLQCGVYGSEREILRELCAYLQDEGTSSEDIRRGAKPDVWLTFYGHRFDWSFLLQRVRYQGLDAASYAALARTPRRHMDLADVLTMYGHLEPRLKLAGYCDLYGIASPKTDIASGKDVAAIYASGQYPRIAVYNRADTKAVDDVADFLYGRFHTPEYDAVPVLDLETLLRTFPKPGYPR